MRWRGLAAWVAACAFGALANSHAARATTYVAPPGGPFWMRLAASDAAPTNAHVFLSADPMWHDPQIVCIDDDCSKGERAFVLRRAPSPGVAPGDVAFDLRETKLGDGPALIEISPRAPLDADARFEVWMTQTGGRALFVGTFKTSKAADTSPPAWGAPLRARFVDPMIGARDAASGAFMLDVGQPSSPYVTIVGDAPIDDTTKPDKIWYALWLDDGNGRVDFDKPPHIVKRGDGAEEKGLVHLGRTTLYTDEARIQFSKKRASMKVGVRAYDMAGNASAPVQIIVDLKHPEPRPR